jgi:hypothetical protein
MKQHSTIIFSLMLAAVMSCWGQEPSIRPSGVSVRVDKTLLDFSKHLDGPAKWKLGSAGTLSLKMDNDSTVFLIDDAKEVFRLNSPEYIAQAVMSDDGSSLVLVAMKTQGFGSDFATLVSVQPVVSGVRVVRLLESGAKLFGGRKWWISELGAVSNDGTRILAKFGVDYPPDDNGLTRMGYRWYTVELATGKILSEGLTIGNSKSPPKK